MHFRTQIPVPKSNFPIDYDARIVSLGSCFAENIGAKLDYFKFCNETNPFGIIFNPVSLDKVLRRCLELDFYTEEDVFFHNERWNCYEVHSERSNADKEEFLFQLNQTVKRMHQQLQEASHCIITLGTAWVYRHLQSGEIVANCHKVPQKHFAKELLSVAAIQDSLTTLITRLRSFNPELQFIFTVSPVRHLKDGFVENQQSKAHLIAALHEVLQTEINKDTTQYFPSYEIMMDELRDYRFYAEDMLHPNTVAINYIWESFRQTMVAERSYPVMDAVEVIQKGLLHRPFHPDSESHLQFTANLKRKMALLQEKYPDITF